MYIYIYIYICFPFGDEILSEILSVALVVDVENCRVVSSLSRNETVFPSGINVDGGTTIWRPTNLPP